MADIALLNRKGEIVGTAIIDDADLDEVSRYRWGQMSGYAVANIEGRQVLLHRLLMRVDRGVEVDHVNRNRTDNGRANLRCCTHAQNHQNRPAHRNSSSGHRGVQWCAKKNRWRAVVKLNGKRAFSRYCRTVEQAVEAVKGARARLMPFSEEAA